MFRDECLNESRFITLDDVKAKIEAQRIGCYSVRLHSSPDVQPTAEFAHRIPRPEHSAV